MVNVVSKRCCQQGCYKVPSYGVDGSTKPEFCFDHKKGGMMNVVSKRLSLIHISEPTRPY